MGAPSGGRGSAASIPVPIMLTCVIMMTHHNAQSYAGMINNSDEYTGKMVDALVANNNMWANTLLVYASDNGTPL